MTIIYRNERHIQVLLKDTLFIHTHTHSYNVRRTKFVKSDLVFFSLTNKSPSIAGTDKG